MSQANHVPMILPGQLMKICLGNMRVKPLVVPLNVHAKVVYIHMCITWNVCSYSSYCYFTGSQLLSSMIHIIFKWRDWLW